ncbi:MAG: hypothetical protein KGS72_04480 [Cyanobacteria bacterium REEB67]|nr:hypothetical protein [Cyanobacteria bacterium REEB67]
MRSQNRGNRRKAKGQAIAEFGPALGIVLICFFFPLVDILAVGLAYGFLMVLNYNQVHEASLLPASSAQDPAGVVRSGIVNQWLNGMGHFVKTEGKPDTAVSYRANTVNADGVTDQTVIVTTTAVCDPFLPIPLPFANVPGLNGPMNLAITSERPMENPDDVTQ